MTEREQGLILALLRNACEAENEKANQPRKRRTMPTAHLALRPLCYLLPMVLLLALPGCMGRWQLGDVGRLLHPSQPAPPALSAKPQPGDMGTTPPSTTR